MIINCCSECTRPMRGKRRCRECQMKMVKAGMLTGCKWLKKLREMQRYSDGDAAMVVRVSKKQRHNFNKVEAIGGVWLNLMRIDGDAFVCSVRYSELKLAMKIVYDVGSIDDSIARCLKCNQAV